MPRSSEKFDRWHRNVARGSQIYADVSRRRIEAFCRQMKTDPERLVALAKAPLRALIEDYLDAERSAGHSGEYVRTTLKALRSWLTYNEGEFPKGLNVPNERVHPRVDKEEPVTPEQLRRVVLAANPGQRVVVTVMAHTGVRPQVLGSYDGTDGLRVSDFPEMTVRADTVEFEKLPTIVRVRPTASKAGHGYFTFLGSEGCDYLKQHLEERIREGEKVTKDTDIISPRKGTKQFMTTINVGDRARQALRAAGVAARPYALRSYFFSRCLEAANAGKVSDRYVEFWAGHKGDVTSRHYTTGRPNLPSSMVEDMRAAYKRCEPFLSTAPSPRSDDRDFREMLLRVVGVPPDVIAGHDLNAMTKDEVLALADRYSTHRSGQKSVPLAEVDGLLASGWEFVAPLGTDRAVLRFGERQPYSGVALPRTGLNR